MSRLRPPSPTTTSRHRSRAVRATPPRIPAWPVRGPSITFSRLTSFNILTPPLLPPSSTSSTSFVLRLSALHTPQVAITSSQQEFFGMAQPPTVMPHEMMPPQPHQQQITPLQNINTYYPETPGDLSGGLPINLDSLRDGPPGSKPFYPYSTLIRYAIKGAPNQKLLLEDIYYAIESRFPYFRTAPPGWKNSVRHNLSLNPCFEKVPRPLTDRGKGSYWTVNDNVDPRTGVHRIRKKKPKGKGRSQSNSDQQTDQQGDSQQEDLDYHQGEAQQFQEQNFVAPAIVPNEAGPSGRPPVPPPGFPQPYGTFDPAFGYPPTVRYPPLYPNETLEFDEHGQVDWAAMWHKELQGLLAITEEQDKNNAADQEWYRSMLTRLRTAMMAPEQPIPPPTHIPGAAGNAGAVPEQ